MGKRIPDFQGAESGIGNRRYREKQRNRQKRFPDFHEICREKELAAEVLEAAGRHLDYIIGHIGEGEGKKKITRTSNIWRGINSSSILEPVVRLYRLKPEKRYLDFADYIVENGGAEGFDQIGRAHV